MSCEINYDEQKRLAAQFRGKPNLQSLIRAFRDSELDQASCDVLNKRGLNTAQGVQLDGIGEIIGLARPREAESDVGNFGFLEDGEANGFTSLTNISTGGFFSQLNPPLTVPINDDKYRLAIKGKIFQNHTNMTVDQTLNILAIVFQADIKYFLPTNLSPMYEIGKTLQPFEQTLLNEFPETIGIRGVTFKTFSEDSAFGFAEDPDTLGFTTTLDNTIGGNFANLI